MGSFGAFLGALVMVGGLGNVAAGAPADALADPTLHTQLHSTATTPTSLEVAAVIDSTGGTALVSGGACLGTSPDPDLSALCVTAALPNGNETFTGLTPETLYHIRAFVVSDTGTYFFAPEITVTTPAVLLPFSKITPAQGATGVATTGTVSWEPVYGATSYQYCFGFMEQVGFVCMGNKNTVTTNSGPIYTLLNNNYKWFWQVWAVNDGGVLAANGGTAWSFTTVALPCTFSLSSVNGTLTSFLAGSASNDVIFFPSGCVGGSWAAASDSPWLRATPSSGTAPAAITIAWDQNLTTASRTGHLTIGGATLAVAQDALPQPAATDPDHDIDGDHWPDLLFRHLYTGDLVWWSMKAVTRVSVQMPTPATARTNWRLVGTADANGDGKPDLFWQEQTTGDLIVWFMDGAARTSYAYVSDIRPADPAWKVVALADLNGDGKPDLIWEHSLTGALAVWYLDGATVIGRGLIDPPMVRDMRWHLVGTGDFNGNGQPDLLWQHDDGTLVVWFMNGPSRTGVSYLSPMQVMDPNWTVVATADFNGDGHVDVLFQHRTTGALVVWFMAGTTRTGWASLAPDHVLDPAWRVGGRY